METNSDYLQRLYLDYWRLAERPNSPFYGMGKREFAREMNSRLNTDAYSALDAPAPVRGLQIMGAIPDFIGESLGINKVLGKASRGLVDIFTDDEATLAGSEAVGQEMFGGLAAIGTMMLNPWAGAAVAGLDAFTDARESGRSIGSSLGAGAINATLMKLLPGVGERAFEATVPAAERLASRIVIKQAPAATKLIQQSIQSALPYAAREASQFGAGVAATVADVPLDPNMSLSDLTRQEVVVPMLLGDTVFVLGDVGIRLPAQHLIKKFTTPRPQPQAFRPDVDAQRAFDYAEAGRAFDEEGYFASYYDTFGASFDTEVAAKNFLRNAFAAETSLQTPPSDFVSYVDTFVTAATARGIDIDSARVLARSAYNRIRGRTDSDVDAMTRALAVVTDPRVKLSNELPRDLADETKVGPSARKLWAMHREEIRRGDALLLFHDKDSDITVFQTFGPNNTRTLKAFAGEKLITTDKFDAELSSYLDAIQTSVAQYEANIGALVNASRANKNVHVIGADLPVGTVTGLREILTGLDVDVPIILTSSANFGVDPSLALLRRFSPPSSHYGNAVFGKYGTGEFAVVSLKDLRDTAEGRAALMHEVGHVVERAYARKYPTAVDALKKEMAARLAKWHEKGASVKELRKFAANVPKYVRELKGGDADLSFSEWFANQFSKWVDEPNAKPATVMERYFQGIANWTRQVWEKFLGKKAGTLKSDAKFRAWMEQMSRRFYANIMWESGDVAFRSTAERFQLGDRGTDALGRAYYLHNDPRFHGLVGQRLFEWDRSGRPAGVEKVIAQAVKDYPLIPTARVLDIETVTKDWLGLKVLDDAEAKRAVELVRLHAAENADIADAVYVGRTIVSRWLAGELPGQGGKGREGGVAKLNTALDRAFRMRKGLGETQETIDGPFTKAADAVASAAQWSETLLYDGLDVGIVHRGKEMFVVVKESERFSRRKFNEEYFNPEMDERVWGLWEDVRGLTGDVEVKNMGVGGKRLLWSLEEYDSVRKTFGKKFRIPNNEVLTEEGFVKLAGRDGKPIKADELVLMKRMVPEAFEEGKVKVGLLMRELPKREPAVRTRVYGMEGEVSEAKKAYNKLMHEWADNLPQEQRTVLQRTIATATSGRGVLDVATAAEFDSFTPADRQKAAQLVDLALQVIHQKYAGTEPRATSYYESVSPFNTDEFPVTRVDITLPREDANATVLWDPDTLHENLPDTLGWEMMQFVPGPDGKPVAFVAELQSRWGQRRYEVVKTHEQNMARWRAEDEETLEKIETFRVLRSVDHIAFLDAQGEVTIDISPSKVVRDLLRQDYGPGEHQMTPELRKLIADAAEAYRRTQDYGKPSESVPSHELLNYYQELVLKAAIRHAREQGVDTFVLSDAETAMMTEGHDTNPRMIDMTPEVRRRLNERFTDVDKNPAFFVEDGRYFVARGQGADVRNQLEKYGLLAALRPKQEPGMRVNYDTKHLKLMKKIIGKDYTRVALGLHKNISPKGSFVNEQGRRVTQLGSPVFKDASGKPKTQVTGYAFDISHIPGPREGLDVNAVLDTEFEVHNMGVSSSAAKLGATGGADDVKANIKKLLGEEIGSGRHLGVTKASGRLQQWFEEDGSLALSQVRAIAKEMGYEGEGIDGLVGAFAEYLVNGGDVKRLIKASPTPLASLFRETAKAVDKVLAAGEMGTRYGQLEGTTDGDIGDIPLLRGKLAGLLTEDEATAQLVEIVQNLGEGGLKRTLETKSMKSGFWKRLYENSLQGFMGIAASNPILRPFAEAMSIEIRDQRRVFTDLLMHWRTKDVTKLPPEIEKGGAFDKVAKDSKLRRALTEIGLVENFAHKKLDVLLKEDDERITKILAGLSSEQQAWVMELRQRMYAVQRERAQLQVHVTREIDQRNLALFVLRRRDGMTPSEAERFADVLYRVEDPNSLLKVLQESGIDDELAASILEFKQQNDGATNRMAKMLYEHPEYVSEQRFGRYLVRFTEDGKSGAVSFDTEAEAVAWIRENDGKNKVTVSSKGFEDTTQYYGQYATTDFRATLDSIIQAKKSIAKNVLGDTTEYFAIADTLDEVMSGVDTATTVARKGTLGVHRGFKAGRDTLDLLDQQFESTRRFVAGITRARTNSIFALHKMAPEFKTQDGARLLGLADQNLRNMRYPDTTWGNIGAKIGFTMGMGFSGSAMLVDTLSAPFLALPMLIERGLGPLKATKLISDITGKVFARYAGNKGGYSDPLWNRLYDRAAREGALTARYLIEAGDTPVLSDVAAHRAVETSTWRDDLTSIPELAYRAASGLYQHAAKISSQIGLFTAFEHSRATKPDAGFDVWYNDAVNFNELAFGQVSRAGRPVGLMSGHNTAFRTLGQWANVLQNFANATVSSWARWTIKSFDTQGRFTPVEKIAARQALGTAVGLTVTGLGITGIPLVSSLSKMLELAFGFSPEKEAEKWIYENIDGDEASKAFVTNLGMRGLFYAAGIPADLHSRLTVGGIFGANEFSGFDASRFAGPFGMLFGMARNALGAARAGRPLEAVGEFVPNGLRRAVQLYLGDGKFTRQGQLLLDPTTSESLGAILGFTPLRLRKTYQRRDAVEYFTGRNRNERTEVADHALGLLDSGNARAARQYLDTMSERLAGPLAGPSQMLRQLQQTVVARDIARRVPLDSNLGTLPEAPMISSVYGTPNLPEPPSMKADYLRTLETKAALGVRVRPKTAFARMRTLGLADELRWMNPGMHSDLATTVAEGLMSPQSGSPYLPANTPVGRSQGSPEFGLWP